MSGIGTKQTRASALQMSANELQLVGLGVTPKSMTRSEFASFIANDSERWAKVIRAANIRPE
jgi:tripartite-type tricarboxylate transporter receptor subunit TctC